MVLINRSLIFIFGYSNSEVEKKSTLNLPYNMKPSVLPRFFIHSPCGKGSDKGASMVSSKISWQSYPLQCKTAKLACIQRWCPWSNWTCKNSEHRVHLNYKTAGCWFTPQHWKKLMQNVVYMSVTRVSVASCFSPISSFASASSLCSFQILWLCNFRSHNLWQISVWKASTSVSNQRISSDPFESPTLSSFHQASY